VTELRCLIYTRISKDKLNDGHGVANQLADLEKRATARGWAVVHRLSDNDIGVTGRIPPQPGGAGRGTRKRCGWFG
jgi:DNA invertase Pin-like site-specific DNA recombinase